MYGWHRWTDRIGGVSWPERATAALCLLSGLNLAGLLLTAGTGLRIHTVPLSTSHFRTALLLTLISVLAAYWTRAGRIGVPVWSRLQSPLCLFVLLTLCYTLPARSAPASGDVLPARYLPLSILREFNLDLDEFPGLNRQRLPYFLQEINGHIVSAYPPWAALPAVPIYLLPVLGGISPDSPFVAGLERVTAALVTALSAAVLCAALRRLTAAPIAWSVALIYGLGTSSLSVSSQELWQHGPSQLWLALMVYWLIRGIREPRATPIAVGSLAMAIITRPSNLLIALPIAAYMILERRAAIRSCLLWALPPLLLFVGYNTVYFGAPFTTGFGALVVTPGWFIRDAASFANPLHAGLMGLLFSPARGLLIYSPVLVFAVWGMVLVWRAPELRVLRYLSLSPLPLLVVAAKWGMWWGGHSVGPRLLADLMPILCVYLYPPLQAASVRPVLRYMVVSLSAWSVGLHGLGAVSDGSWNRYPLDVDRHRERLWSWTESPPVYDLTRLLERVAVSTAPDAVGLQRPTTDRLKPFLVRVHREAAGREPGDDWLAYWEWFLRPHCDAAGFERLGEAVFDMTELWTSRPLPPGELAAVLYRAFLGREPDPSGLIYWEARIRSAGARLAWQGFQPTFRRDGSFFKDPGEAGVGRVIGRFYTELLGREPDHAGLTYWINHSLKTRDLSRPMAAFLDSDEFGRRALPLQAYDPVLYRVLWGRDPDRMTVAFWQGQLQTTLFAVFGPEFLAMDEFRGTVQHLCELPGAPGSGAP